MKQLLVTGITGKSGIAFLQRFAESSLRDTYSLRATVRSTSKLERLREIIPDADFCCGNLFDEIFLAEITRNIDVVLHIAGIDKSPALMKAAARNSVKRIILIHTTGIYSKYKAAGEGYRRIDAEVERIAKENDISLTILRPTMIYGTLNDRNIAQFIKMVDKMNPMPVVNHGAYYLQPVHVEDLAQAYFNILSHPEETGGKSYIISGRDKILLIDVFRIIADALGVHRKFISVPFPIAYLGAWLLYFVSVTKIDMREKVQRLCESRAYPHKEAVRDFGYSPMPFEEGLRQEVQEYILKKTIIANSKKTQ